VVTFDAPSDHSPSGAKQDRRAIQLGLRGDMLRRMATDELLEIIDLSEFVASQRAFARDDSQELLTPVERVFHRSGSSSPVTPRK